MNRYDLPHKEWRDFLLEVLSLGADLLVVSNEINALPDHAYLKHGRNIRDYMISIMQAPDYDFSYPLEYLRKEIEQAKREEEL